MFFATEFILNLLVVQPRLSLPSSYTLTDFRMITFNEGQCDQLYFSIVLNNFFLQVFRL